MFSLNFLAEHAKPAASTEAIAMIEDPMELLEQLDEYQSSLEAFIDSVNEIVNVEKGFNELAEIKTAIESHEVTPTIVALFGEELGKLGIDLSAEKSIVVESLSDKAKSALEWLRKLIEKLVAAFADFFKNLLNKIYFYQGALKKITGDNGILKDVSKIDAEAFKEATIVGLSTDNFATIKGNLKELKELISKKGTDFDEAKATELANAMSDIKAEKKKMSELKFTPQSVKSEAMELLGLLTDAQALKDGQKQFQADANDAMIKIKEGLAAAGDDQEKVNALNAEVDAKKKAVQVRSMAIKDYGTQLCRISHQVWVMSGRMKLLSAEGGEKK